MSRFIHFFFCNKYWSFILRIFIFEPFEIRFENKVFLYWKYIANIFWIANVHNFVIFKYINWQSNGRAFYYKCFLTCIMEFWFFFKHILFISGIWYIKMSLYWIFYFIFYSKQMNSYESYEIETTCCMQFLKEQIQFFIAK